MKARDFWKRLLVIFCAVLVPLLFALNAIQADRYMKAQDEIKAPEDISLLSSGERIGKIAEEELGMRKAESEEIVRVEMRR